MAKPKIYVTKEPVVLNGYQAVFKPSEYGYSLAVDITDSSLINELEVDRAPLLEAQLNGKAIKNKKRASLKPEPWEEREDAEGVYNLKFKWADDSRPAIVDAEGTPIISENLRVFSGSTVRVAFTQTGYTLKDGATYGTKVNIKSIQIISLAGKEPPMSAEDAADLFGTHEGGFKVGDIPDAAGDDEEGGGDY
jgi:hypothetical protein